MKRLLYSTILFFAGLSVMQAQFNWQGVLRDADNKPVPNQSVSIQLTIMQNGNMVMQETHSTTTSELGLMNVAVCNGTNVSGDCASIDYATGGLMLNVAVDADGGSNYEDYGSSPILMVPVARYAVTAGQAVNDAVDDADADPTNELQELQFDNTKRELSITGVQGVIRIPSTGGDADADPTNEIQELAKNNLGEIVLQRNGGLIVDGKVTDEVDDADADPTNELQDLSLNGTTLEISDGNSVDLSGLGGGGSSVWTKQNENIYYETATPGNRIEFGPGLFNAGMSANQRMKLDGRSNKFTEEVSFDTPNSGAKTHAIGRYFQDFPAPDHSQLYSRFEDDTTYSLRTLNYSGETVTEQYLAGVLSGTKAFGFFHSTQGGFGSMIQFVGNRPGVRMGILTGGLPFVGVVSPSDPTSLVSYLSTTSVGAAVKNFFMDHPNDPTKQIWYACIEGPEAAAYERGSAQLVNGEAFIPFSEHFELVINPESMTVVLTPNSAESLGLAVVEKSADGFRVKELHKGTGNYSFDWEAKAVRKGYEDYKVIRPKSDMKVFDPREELD